MKFGAELKAPEALGVLLPALKLEFETGDVRLRPKDKVDAPVAADHGESTIIVGAKFDGARGLPHHSDVDLERTQRSIIQRCRILKEKIDGVTAANREAFTSDFRKFEELKIDSDRIVRQYRQWLSSFFAANKAIAIDAVRKANQAEARLEAFKGLHGLDRDAVVHTDEVTGWAIVGGFALFEFLLSWMLFAIAMPGGGPEALALLMPIAVVNVLLGLAAGYYGVRNFYRPDLGQKVIGGALVVGAMILSIYINLLIARTRDGASETTQTSLYAILGQAARDAGRPPPEPLAALPLGITNVESFIFLVLGMVTWGASMWKGVTGFDDVVPGFRTVARERLLAWRYREALFAAMRQSLQQQNSDLLQRLSEFQSNIRSARDEMEAQFRHHKQALITVKAEFAGIKLQAENQVKTYREVNRNSRRAKRFFFWNPISPTPPPYFTVAVSDIAAPAESYDSLEPELERARSRASAMIEQIVAAAGALSDEMGGTSDRMEAFEAEVEAAAARAPQAKVAA